MKFIAATVTTAISLAAPALLFAGSASASPKLVNHPTIGKNNDVVLTTTVEVMPESCIITGSRPNGTGGCK